MTELSWVKLKERVYERANGCCEYCQTCQANTGQTMHVDHIDPDGGDDLDNLCLACWNCNTSKHEAVSELDPETAQIVSLYNPRTQTWADHFQWLEGGAILEGLTPHGRATIIRLKINRSTMVIARKRWVTSGHHPPQNL